MPMNLNRDEVGETLILSVEGSVDIATSPALRGELRVGVEAKRSRIVVDMTGVSFVDSSGLATLIEALQGTTKYGGELRLFGLTKTVMGVFQLANLDHVFTISESREDALAG